MNTEYFIASLPGSSDNERLAVVLVHTPNGPSKFSLRQQCWTEGIGWYDQKSLDLAADQFRQLQTILGGTARPARTMVQTEEPAILRFPGAQTESA